MVVGVDVGGGFVIVVLTQEIHLYNRPFLYQAFNLFDNLLLLAEGGRVAFAGRREGCLQFFSEIGRPCPKTWNPADHFVHAVAVVPNDEVASRQKIAEICHQFESRSKPDKDFQLKPVFILFLIDYLRQSIERNELLANKVSILEMSNTL